MAKLKLQNSIIYETALNIVEMATPEVALEIKNIFADETLPLESFLLAYTSETINDLGQLSAVLKRLKEDHSH